MSSAAIDPVLIGRTLRNIAYELLPWEDSPTVRSEIDSVSTAVTLTFEEGHKLRFCWIVGEGSECLAVSPSIPDLNLNPMIRVIDVTDHWSGFKGSAVVRHAVSLQQTDWGLQPWAYRLFFENGRSLVIALGELLSSIRPSYIPDNLLITDVKSIAESYWPVAAASSAWVLD